MFPLSSAEQSMMLSAMLSGFLPNAATISMADRSTHTVFTPIPGLRAMRGPAIAGQYQDASAQNSLGWLELISVLKTGGALFLNLFYQAGHANLMAASLAQSVETFQLILPGSLTLQFTALVALTMDAPIIGPLRAQATLTLTGQALVF